jgi:biopolymer transport protein ExbD
MGGGGGGEEGDFGFQIAPMVDVVFVLMLFFMATTGDKVTEKELRISLPSGTAPGENKEAKTPIYIDISSDGAVFVNNTPMGTGPKDRELVQLRELLKRSLEGQTDTDPVIIRPAPDTKQERVVDVLNACAATKVVKNLSFS